MRGVLSLSVSVLAASQLLYNPAGHAQAAPPGEPEVQAQGSIAAPPAPPAPPGPPGPPPAYGPVVTLRADSPKARLQILNQQLRWQDVCVTPCNVPVNPAGSYRVGGGTIRGSDTFSMPRPSGPVVIDAQVGSTVKHWVGVGLIIAGVAGALGGVYYYSAADDLANSSAGLNDKGFYQAVGIVDIVIGVALLAIGIPLSLSSTSVEVR